MKTLFKFIEPGKRVDEDLELVLVKMVPADPAKGDAPATSSKCDVPAALW